MKGEEGDEVEEFGWSYLSFQFFKLIGLVLLGLWLTTCQTAWIIKNLNNSVTRLSCCHFCPAQCFKFTHCNCWKTKVHTGALKAKIFNHMLCDKKKKRHRLASAMLRCILDGMYSYFRAHAKASVLQTAHQLIRNVHTTQSTEQQWIFASCSWQGSLTIPREGGRWAGGWVLSWSCSNIFSSMNKFPQTTPYTVYEAAENAACKVSQLTSLQFSIWRNTCDGKGNIQHGSISAHSKQNGKDTLRCVCVCESVCSKSCSQSYSTLKTLNTLNNVGFCCNFAVILILVTITWNNQD